jgi:predicted ATPase/DNA-binding CsgD family transcriptional regulator/tetratricopeptide (TPR) repeat protein
MHNELIGREHEVRAVRQLLEQRDVVLVTITGPGGIGKTRLALEVAEQGLPRFDDGAHFVNLATLRDPELVPNCIAAALGLHGRGDMQERVTSYLERRRALLVLDNFEQIAGAAAQLGELLSRAPGVKLLVTSRTRLHLTQEQEFPLRALTLPRFPPHDVADAQASAAVTLFVRCASQVQPRFALTEDNVKAVAAICIRLDGWPLALELAAARVKLMAPQMLLERLQGSLRLLFGGPADAPQRQRTLRNTLSWSHELLSDDERTLFAQLSVFTGGATIEAMQAVCSVQPDTLAQTLVALIDHSMVTTKEGRFSMLETVREYAGEQLEACGQGAALRLRHAEHFVTQARLAAPLWRGPGQKAWLERLAADLDNMREAFRTCLDNKRQDLALPLCSALGPFWTVRGLVAEGRRWAEAALSIGDGADAALRAPALYWAALLARRMGDYGPAMQWHGEALVLFREIGDAAGAAVSCIELGWCHFFTGDYERASASFEEGLAAGRAEHDPWLEARGLACLGLLLDSRGEAARAYPLIELALAKARAAGDDHLTASIASGLGLLELKAGRMDQARVLTEEALEMSRVLGARANFGGYLSNLAFIARKQNDLQRAHELLVEALSEAEAASDMRILSGVLEEAAKVCLATSRADAAVRLLAAAAVQRERMGMAREPFKVAELQRCEDAAMEQLGAGAFGRAWAQGELLSLAEAMTLARSSKPDPSPAPDPGRAPARKLTPRELDVLRVVAQGLSDQEVAERLRISRATASKHVANLLGKTQQPNRTALALWAIEQGLAHARG